MIMLEIGGRDWGGIERSISSFPFLEMIGGNCIPLNAP